FQAEDGIRDGHVTGVQTCALPISSRIPSRALRSAGVCDSKSNRDNALRNDSEALSKYGVPGPILGRVWQMAPAGMKDSWPFSLRSEERRVGKEGRWWGGRAGRE